MKFNFRISIGIKLVLAFGFLTLAFIFFSVATFNNLQKNKSLTNKITHENIKLENLLSQLITMIDNSQILVIDIANNSQNENVSNNKKLETILEIDFLELKNESRDYIDIFSKEELEQFNHATRFIEDSIFPLHYNILKKNSEAKFYSDSLKRTFITDLGKISSRSEKVLDDLTILKNSITENTVEGYAKMKSSFESFQSFTVLLAIIIIVISILIASFTIRNLLIPIIKIKRVLLGMSKGIIENIKSTSRKDELGEMIAALAKVNEGLLKTSNFSIEIGNGNYNVEYSPMSSEDTLGNSLLNLRDNLEKATKEANERKKIDDIQNWVTNGLAKFADLLRTNNDNIKKLGQVVISNLVKYMNINQGGLFVLVDEDQNDIHLNLVSVYAFNREKYAEKKVYPGEGLVGTCYEEKETIYLTEVPEAYITITSGLGKANPKSILIVPLRMEDEVLGVIELASFKQLEKHEIEFVEKIAESIASTLINARINEQTGKLLKQSEDQAAQMKEQEEAMQQNMEEMLSTQEDAFQKEEELRELLRKANEEIDILKARISQM